MIRLINFCQYFFRRNFIFSAVYFIQIKAFCVYRLTIICGQLSAARVKYSQIAVWMFRVNFIQIRVILHGECRIGAVCCRLDLHRHLGHSSLRKRIAPRHRRGQGVCTSVRTLLRIPLRLGPRDADVLCLRLLPILEVQRRGQGQGGGLSGTAGFLLGHLFFVSLFVLVCLLFLSAFSALVACPLFGGSFLLRGLFFGGLLFHGLFLFRGLFGHVRRRLRLRCFHHGGNGLGEHSLQFFPGQRGGLAGLGGQGPCSGIQILGQIFVLGRPRPLLDRPGRSHLARRQTDRGLQKRGPHHEGQKDRHCASFHVANSLSYIGLPFSVGRRSHVSQPITSCSFSSSSSWLCSTRIWTLAVRPAMVERYSLCRHRGLHFSGATRASRDSA